MPRDKCCQTEDERRMLLSRCVDCPHSTLRFSRPADAANHPPHYGGANNPYEAIKVIEAWDLGFNLGNTVKYIARAEHKGTTVQDLEKARWYLDREIERRKT